MARCGALHPEHGLPCVLDYEHPEHQVAFDRQWVCWPNAEYSPPRGKIDQMEEFSSRSLAAKMPVNREKKISVPLQGAPHER